MTLTLTVATMLAVVGCGGSGGSSSADPADVAAVARQVGDGNDFSKAQARCVAEHATPKLSAKALKSAHKSGSSDLTSLPKADQEVVFTSVSACVSTAQLVPSLTKAFETGTDKIDAKSAKCATKALVALYPDAGDMMRDLSGGKTSKFQKAMLKCVMGGDTSASGSGSGSGSSVLRDALVTEMTNGGMTAAQANCVADKVLAEVPTDDLTKIGSSGTVPADIESEVETAVVSCATGG
jgi:hypothetical protein